MQIVIDYNPEILINREKHDAWERVIDKYHILSIGSDDGSCRLVSFKNLDLEILRTELKPIKILSSS